MCTNNGRAWRRRSLMLMATLPFLTGCPFRHESIEVARDGSVRMKVRFEATPDELRAFDAVPTKEGGWAVERRTERSQEDDKKETEILEAEQSFTPGTALPSSFAPPNGADADLVLEFPTEVRRERRADGTYFTFRRVYRPRPWAQTDYWREKFIDDDIKRLSEKGIENLDADDRTKVISALASVEAHSEAEYAMAAVARVAPAAAPEVGLRARAALLWVYDPDHTNYEALVAKCETGTESARASCFDAETAALAQKANDAFRTSLRDFGGWEADRVSAFQRAYEREKRRHEITERVSGHAFEVMVMLPGRLVAHNADETEKQAEDPKEAHFADADSVAFVWKFDGRAFRDRPHALVAVTMIPNVEADDPANRAPEPND